MRICVFGAGAVGGHAAGRLARGGATVSVVARGPHLAAIKARGLEIRAPDGAFRVDVAASGDAAELGPQDAVFVTLKAPSLPGAAASIRALLGPDTAVVFALNGIPWWYFYKEGGPHDGRRIDRLDPGGTIWDTIGPHRAIGGVINSACTVIEPGVIRVANANGRITLGEPDGTVSPRAETIAAALRAGGMGSEAVPDIRSRIWGKLVLNIGSGPMGVLTGLPGHQVLAEAPCQDALRGMVAEVAAVAAAMGCPIATDADAQIANSQKLMHTASIVQDLQLGRPMEIDAIFAQPVELARLAGVATPTLDLLVTLAQLRARAAGLYS